MQIEVAFGCVALEKRQRNRSRLSRSDAEERRAETATPLGQPCRGVAAYKIECYEILLQRSDVDIAQVLSPIGR